MNQPNFFILGAAKCGTTSLYKYLNYHPQIYMSPIKEPNFFACENHQLDFKGLGYDKYIKSHTLTDYKSYLSLFKSASQEKAIGEASWSNLYYPQASERIKHYFPEAKFIVILRNPIDRAFSHYQYLLQYDREEIDNFCKAIDHESERIRQNYWADWHYINLGFYSKQIKRYFNLFNRERIKIIYFEKFILDPFKTLEEIFDFLELDPTYTIDPQLLVKKYNQTKLPKNQLTNLIFKTTKRGKLKQLIKRIAPGKLYCMLKSKRDYLENLNHYKPVLSIQIRKRLQKIYFDEIYNLENLLGISLNHWK